MLNIEVKNGLYYVVEEIDKVVTEISKHKFMKDAEEALDYEEAKREREE